MIYVSKWSLWLHQWNVNWGSKGGCWRVRRRLSQWSKWEKFILETMLLGMKGLEMYFEVRLFRIEWGFVGKWRWRRNAEQPWGLLVMETGETKIKSEVWVGYMWDACESSQWKCQVSSCVWNTEERFGLEKDIWEPRKDEMVWRGQQEKKKSPGLNLGKCRSSSIHKWDGRGGGRVSDAGWMPREETKRGQSFERDRNLFY